MPSLVVKCGSLTVLFADLVNFIAYSVKNKYGGDSAPRTSFFVNIVKGDVFVLKWDAKMEAFEILGRGDAAPYVEGVKTFQFDANLGTYPHEKKGQWSQLSEHITNDLVLKLQPIGAQIVASGKALTREEQRQLDEAMQEMGIQDESRQEEIDKFVSEAQCYYTTVPRALIPRGSTPAQITSIHMDRSPVLEHMIQKNYNGDSILILGEMQFSFVCFLLGQSFEAFEQWKTILELLLHCESAVYDMRRVSFWLAFIKAFEHQLAEAPDDFFIDIVEGKNILHHSLCDFFEITSDQQTPEPVAEASSCLKEFAEDRFGIPFDGSGVYDGDEAPAIVEV